VTLVSTSHPAAPMRRPSQLALRVVMLVVSLPLVVLGGLLLFANASWAYKSTVAGDTRTAHCQPGVTALVGGGTRSPFAYHAYDLKPSNEPDPTMRMVEQSVAKDAQQFEKMWHEEQKACVRDVRYSFGGGTLMLFGGVALFVLRRRLPGSRRDMRRHAVSTA
jgi:hypothetical protein